MDLGTSCVLCSTPTKQQHVVGMGYPEVAFKANGMVDACCSYAALQGLSCLQFQLPWGGGWGKSHEPHLSNPSPLTDTVWDPHACRAIIVAVHLPEYCIQPGRSSRLRLPSCGMLYPLRPAGPRLSTF